MLIFTHFVAEVNQAVKIGCIRLILLDSVKRSCKIYYIPEACSLTQGSYTIEYEKNDISRIKTAMY